MLELERLQEMINRINSENSLLIIKSILSEYEDCIELLYWIYNPKKTFKNITSEKIKENQNLRYNDFKVLIHLLYFISLEENTFEQAIGSINSTIEKRFPEYKELIYDIIDKKLKCDIDIELINEIWPGLINKEEI